MYLLVDFGLVVSHAAIGGDNATVANPLLHLLLDLCVVLTGLLEAPNTCECHTNEGIEARSHSPARTSSTAEMRHRFKLETRRTAREQAAGRREETKVDHLVPVHVRHRKPRAQDTDDEGPRILRKTSHGLSRARQLAHAAYLAEPHRNYPTAMQSSASGRQALSLRHGPRTMQPKPLTSSRPAQMDMHTRLLELQYHERPRRAYQGDASCGTGSSHQGTHSHASLV